MLVFLGLFYMFVLMTKDSCKGIVVSWLRERERSKDKY
jgi:hypothetical protein